MSATAVGRNCCDNCGDHTQKVAQRWWQWCTICLCVGIVAEQYYLNGGDKAVRLRLGG